MHTTHAFLGSRKVKFLLVLREADMNALGAACVVIIGMVTRQRPSEKAALELYELL